MANLNEFMPHGFCIAWNPELLAMHVISDLFIALAYFSIPLGIVYVVNKKPNTQFQPIYYLFAGFILACGVTHVMGIVTLWYPLYYLQGWSKVFTALISILTALYVLSRLGQIMSLPSLDELNGLNNALSAEIEHRKEIEESLKISEKAALQAQRTQSAFLANMSHEIRTPMNGIIGGLELLRKTSLNRDQFDLVSIAKQSANALLTLLNDILDISKVESGELKLRTAEVDLLQLIEDVAANLSFESDRKQIELVCPANYFSQGIYLVDPVRLRQVLINLVSNAVKFTSDGYVCVYCREIEVNADDIALVEFVVEDTGIGIKKEDQATLFKRFKQVDDSSTRRASGSGLGLAIVKELVTLMGGTVGLESEYGTGTKIILRLPLKKLSKDSIDQAVSTDNIYQDGKIYLALQHPKVIAMVEDVIHSLGMRSVVLSGDDFLSFSSTLGSGDKLVVSTYFLKTNQVEPEVFNEAVARTQCLLVARAAELIDNNFVLPLEGSQVIAKPVSQQILGAWLCRESTRKSENHQLSRSTSQTTKFNGSVLVVEDAPMNQMIVSSILRKFGIEPEIANNGAEALQMLNRSSFDLILMDGQMPVMDGYEATRRIRATDPLVFDPRVPIVALTAHAMVGEEQKCLDAGMNGYLTKPIMINQLVEVLATYLKRNI